MELTDLVGITLELEFDYKIKEQKQKLHPLLWSNNKLNKLFKDMLSMISEDFFNSEIENLNVPKDEYRIVIDLQIMNDPGMDELLDWVSVDIDITTIPTYYDKIFDYMESYIYEDLLIDVFKRNIISYFSKVNLEEPISVKIEITEIGGN